MHEHNTGEYLNNDQHKDTTNPKKNIVFTIENDDMESYVPAPESTPETVPESTDVDEWIKSAKIDPTAEIQKPPVVLKIGEADVCYLGDFSCITGKEKSKKTFLVSMFISSFLKGSNYNISGIKHDNKKRIVWFDTEQSKYHTVKAFRRALRYKASGGSGAGENGTPKWTCSFGAGPIRSIIKHPVLRATKLGRIDLFPKDM